MKSIPFLLVLATSLCSFSAIHGQNGVTNKRYLLQDKIKRIMIPGVSFHETPLDEALNTLQAYSRANDSAERNLGAKGVNIILMKGGQPAPNLTIQLNKMPLEKVLDFITESVGWSYQLRDVAIVVSKRPSLKGRAHGLGVEFFEVSQGSIQQMMALGGVGPRGPDAPDPFGGGAAKPNDQASRIKQFLADSGVRFDEAKGHKFVFDGFQIIATNDQVSLDRIREILWQIDRDVTAQINVEFKILEAPLGALDKAIAKAIGGERPTPSQAVQIENRFTKAALLELKKSEGVELKSLPRLVIMDRQPAQLKVGEEMIYPTDFAPPHPVASAGGKNIQPGIPLPQFDTVAPDDEQPGFRMVGIRISVTARHEPSYDLVNLELMPKITEFKGYEEFGAGIKVPKFWAWSLNTSVNVRRNHTVIFRGPASEEKREIILFVQANTIR